MRQTDTRKIIYMHQLSIADEANRHSEYVPLLSQTLCHITKVQSPLNFEGAWCIFQIQI